EALENLTTTSRTLVEQRENLTALTAQLTTTAGDYEEFLRENRANLISLGESARPTLDVLAKYSPQYPCFLRQMDEYVPRLHVVFVEGTDDPDLHVSLEITARRGKYVSSRDELDVANKGGTRCYDMVHLTDPIPE